MVHGVFQQIDQYLLDQQGIHRNADEILRDRNLHILVRVALMELLQNRIDQFLQDGGGLAHGHGLTVDPCDREQVFHDSDQVLGILLHIPQKPELLITVQAVVIIDQCAAGAVDGGQGCAKIMGDGPKKIAAHFLLFGFHPQLILSLQLGREGTGKDGDDQHDQSGYEVGRGQKIKGEVWKRKNVIVDQYACQRGEDTTKVALSNQRDEKNGQNEYHRHQRLGMEKVLQQKAKKKGRAQQQQDKQKVAEDLFGFCHGDHSSYTDS